MNSRWHQFPHVSCNSASSASSAPGMSGTGHDGQQDFGEHGRGERSTAMGRPRWAEYGDVVSGRQCAGRPSAANASCPWRRPVAQPASAAEAERCTGAHCPEEPAGRGPGPAVLGAPAVRATQQARPGRGLPRPAAAQVCMTRCWLLI